MYCTWLFFLHMYIINLKYYNTTGSHWILLNIPMDIHRWHDYLRWRLTNCRMWFVYFANTIVLKREFHMEYIINLILWKRHLNGFLVIILNFIPLFLAYILYSRWWWWWYFRTPIIIHFLMLLFHYSFGFSFCNWSPTYYDF